MCSSRVLPAQRWHTETKQMSDSGTGPSNMPFVNSRLQQEARACVKFVTHSIHGNA